MGIFFHLKRDRPKPGLECRIAIPCGNYFLDWTVIWQRQPHMLVTWIWRRSSRLSAWIHLNDIEKSKCNRLFYLTVSNCYKINIRKLNNYLPLFRKEIFTGAYTSIWLVSGLDCHFPTASESERMWWFNRKEASGFSYSSTAEQVTQGIDGTSLTAIVTGLFSYTYHFTLS